ncbi:lysostaphin resistance A-like protein [Bacillus sp. TD10]|uniref:CPBP family intramembrane glutamic endopeptidase n=1 Tax=Bacillus sp. TD10 TaxID=1672662 RepID=UPI00391C63F4
MNETEFDTSGEKRKEFNLTYKEFFGMIFYMIGISFIGGIFLGLAEAVFGEQAANQFLDGSFWLIIDAFATLSIIFLYKPARHFISGIWDTTVLKKPKTYIYILIGFIVISVSQYITLTLLGIENADQQRNLLSSTNIQNSLVQIVIYILSVAIITPIKEEIMYRGILYRFLKKKHGFIMGIIVSSILFGFLHVGFPITAMIMGIVFVVLYQKTHSIIPSVILHIFWNLFASILIILS